MRTPIRQWRPDAAPRLRVRQSRRFLQTVEQLEARCLLSTGGAALPAGIVAPAITPSFPFGGFFGGGGGSGSGTTTVQQNFGPTAPLSTSLSPAQIQGAYGFSSSALSTLLTSSYPSQLGTTYNALAGKGTTIAIVDAYVDPTIVSDVGTFSSEYGLPAMDGQNGHPTLTVNALGSQVDTTGGWELETALDVEMAHLIAPAANILLVEAASNSTSALLSAVQVANQTPGVVAVSMSWGGSEFGISSGTDAKYFSTPGITYFAASGDNGAGAEWPASSASVVGVGGTSLTVNGTTVNNTTTYSYGSETAWSGSGGGPSRVVSQPSYQQTYTGNSVLASTLNRGTPDVSFDANPNNGSGVAVYDSYETVTVQGGRRGSTTTIEQKYNWTQIGGTSVGTPAWAATAAIADGIRLQANPSSALSGASQFLPALYAIGSSGSATYGSSFLDVTSGSNGYSAGAGYDFATGLGSPNAAGLVANLAGVTGSGASVKLGAKAIASPGVQPAVATPHDITIITIITLPAPGAPTNSPIQTPSPTPTPTQTQPVLVTIISLSPTNVVSASAIVVVFAPLNPTALATTASPALVHGTIATGAETGLASVTVLTASPSTAPRPNQPLDAHPAFDRDLLLRLHEDTDPFAPLDYKPPASPWDFVAHDRALDGLDLLAIAQQAQALGTVAAVTEYGATPALAPPAAELPTDLNQRAAAPAFDPTLAAVVVTLSGGLAAQAARTDARRRHWLSPRPRR
jgi:hypothetical protein